MRGIVDVLAVEPDGTHLVVDYKTDAVPEDSTPEDYIARNYETQRLVYALAALRAGAPRVEVAYCLLERPAEPVTHDVHRPGRPRARRRACRSSRAGSCTTSTRSPASRTASCAGTAPAAPRSAATRRA